MLEISSACGRPAPRGAASPLHSRWWKPCAAALTLLLPASSASAGAAPGVAFRPGTGAGPTSVAPASAASASTSAATTTPRGGFVWPVEPHEVVRLFDPPEVVWGAGHRGVDLKSHPGADVLAPAEGTVVFSGTVAGRGVMTLRHPQGFDTTYEPVSHQLPKGSVVTRGQRIAVLEPGHCDPACLHWGYKTGPKRYRDPLTLVRRVRPVLLPPI